LLLVQSKSAQAAFDPLAEACLRYTPQLAVRSGEAVFLEISGTEGLYTEDSLRTRLLFLARRFGWDARVGIADSPATALAMARYPDYARTRNLRELPLEALTDFASPFEHDVLVDQRVGKMILILEKLGLQNVGDFASLPSSSLASRFGREAVELAQSVWGRFLSQASQAWPGFRPSERVVEKTDLPEAESALEPLLVTLRSLLDRATARLRGRAERASAVSVSLELEAWSTVRERVRTYKVALPVPQGSATGLLPLLRERLAFELARTPLEAPVLSLTFDVLEGVPGRGAQTDFFHTGEIDAETWDALVARLLDKLGRARVFTASLVERYLPERGFIRSENLEPAVLASAAPAPELPAVVAAAVPGLRLGNLGAYARPARLLRRPEPLDRQGRLLRHLETGRSWRVLDWEGPERLSGEWWHPARHAGGAERAEFAPPTARGFFRDYYRVLTETGEELWVFLNRKTGTRSSFYLHGFFD
jgi:protein ImuB